MTCHYSCGLSSATISEVVSPDTGASVVSTAGTVSSAGAACSAGAASSAGASGCSAASSFAARAACFFAKRAALASFIFFSAVSYLTSSSSLDFSRPDFFDSIFSSFFFSHSSKRFVASASLNAPFFTPSRRCFLIRTPL